MKYLVGTTEQGTAVFSVNGGNAVNLTALDVAVGADLAALINNPLPVKSLSDQVGSAPTVST